MAIILIKQGDAIIAGLLVIWHHNVNKSVFVIVVKNQDIWVEIVHNLFQILLPEEIQLAITVVNKVIYLLIVHNKESLDNHKEITLV
jgi:hypothetical protein